MGKYYAVREGRKPGIYESWDECKAQTSGYSKATFKSFKTKAEAEAFMGEVYENVSLDNEKETFFENILDEVNEEPDNIINNENGTEVIAYVDGSFNIATKVYGAGAILLVGDNEIKLTKSGSDEEMASMRNVAGEVLASTIAIEYAVENEYKAITIYHDYEGIAKWCLGEWKTNKRGTKEYKAFYEEMIKKIKISFVKVKGHSGDKYNDVADMLAKNAAGVE